MNNEVTYQLMFVDETSKETIKTKQNKKLNKSETEPSSTRFRVQLPMTTKGAHSRGNPSGNVLTGHIIDLYAHQPFVYSTKYCWRHITRP
jgi:hypothetical protein